VIILEKAWAKIHGNYHKIIGGNSFEVFRDLLGAPSYYYKIAEEENCWEMIHNATKSDYILCCGTRHTNPDSDITKQM